MKKILITGVGGGGSNNLIESIRQSNLDLTQYSIIGSNISKDILAKSPLEENYILPVATDEKYEQTIIEFVRDKEIDLIIPNNDREVGKISEIREKLDCIVFLPDKETIINCQDKHKMYLKLQQAGIPMAESYELNSFKDIDSAMEKIGGDRFWVRPKRGSGSKGATWVQNAKQAKDWIQLWIDLRGYQLTNFTISEFLPGKDYCFQSVWKDGKMVVGKKCERLSYFFGVNRLSGMSSTPAVARTVRDDKALDTIMQTVKSLTANPHGNFNFDLKGRKDGTMCITECNVGRFCMITPIFDRTGKHSTVEMYIRSAFDDNSIKISNPIDIEEDYYLLRELDTLPTIIHKDKMERFPINLS